MTNDLKPYAIVRIRQLNQDIHEYNGWKVNERPPQVGDIGTLLDVLSTKGLPDKYVVENSASNGITVWLADFFAEELEFVPQ